MSYIYSRFRFSIGFFSFFLEPFLYTRRENIPFSSRVLSSINSLPPPHSCAAVPATPALSYDTLRLYVPSTGRTFAALNATDGSELWKTADTEVWVSPVVSPKDDVVYSVRHGKGEFTAHDVKDGKALWEFDCSTYQSVNPFCQYSVEAELSLSSTGNVLY